MRNGDWPRFGTKVDNSLFNWKTPRNWNAARIEELAVFLANSIKKALRRTCPKTALKKVKNHAGGTMNLPF